MHAPLYPHIRYMGMCCCSDYGFKAFWPGTGYISPFNLGRGGGGTFGG